MKKTLCLLIAVLLCVLPSACALGEASYGTIVALFSQASVLGEPSRVVPGEIAGVEPIELQDKTSWTYVICSSTTENESVVVAGFNHRNEFELTYWDDPFPPLILSVFRVSCQQWDMLSSLLEPGYSLCLILDVRDEDDDYPLVVTDAAVATMVAETLYK